MKQVPIFEWIKDDSDIKQSFGDDVRVYPFHDAPHGSALEYPYAVWQEISGTNDACLRGNGLAEQYRIQFDVFAKTASGALSAASALELALESKGYTASYNLRTREPVTKDYRVSFDMEFWV